jgi:1-acyl-sn-glycerol-3-phosphate acyltransferase
MENERVIDPDQAQILVVNHTSWFDVLVLIAYLPGRSIFVAKKELERIPLFGRAVRSCGHIFIDRRDRSQALDSLTLARKSLEDERPTIIMFPEGTRSPTGELQKFKKGAFVLAIQSGVDVVPAAISGSREVMRKGSFRIRPGTIRVRFGEPISVEGLGIEQRNELTARAREALLGLQSIAR